MELLAELTVSSTIKRLSRSGYSGTYYWDNKIIDFSPIQYRSAQRYGGYVAPSFGSISFSPDLFDSVNWPPPIKNPITLKWATSTGSETGANILFTGTAHLRKISREALVYDLYGPFLIHQTTGGSTFDMTLVQAIKSLSSSGNLNLIVSTSAARTPSPKIKYTVSGNQFSIDLAARFCEYGSHLFYLFSSSSNATMDSLKLVDMFANNGSRTLDEFDFLPSEYEYEQAISLVRSSTITAASTFPYGQEKSVEVYATASTDIQSALNNIRNILVKPRMRARLPITSVFPKPGEQIITTDESQGVATRMSFNARSISYDFNNEEIVVEGEGSLSTST